jgi:hypothetical protein
VQDAPPDHEAVVDLVEREVKKDSERKQTSAQSTAGGGVPTTPDDASKRAQASARKKELKQKGMCVLGGRGAARGLTLSRVDPESILLNEIKAAMYQEWIVTKTNKWNKAQKCAALPPPARASRADPPPPRRRIMGVDLQKIYNKVSVIDKSGLGHLPGQSVKRPVILITDVLEIALGVLPLATRAFA